MAETTGWHPISTAPKDDREADLWKAGTRFCRYFWDSEQRGGGAWSEVGDRHRDWRDRHSIFAPTHWREAPAPPSDLSTAVEG